MIYTVNGRDFGKYLVDARRYAMRAAIETGEQQTVTSNGEPYETWKRGPSGGGAQLAWQRGC